MEFEGRIRTLLPIREGVSKKTGNQWKALPFVFEYFETAEQRWADSVVLETLDTKVIDNLKEGMEVICGWSIKANKYEDRYYNEMRLYKITSVKKAQQQTQQGAPAAPRYEAPLPPPEEKKNDLPF
jgi:hypothetical protein